LIAAHFRTSNDLVAQYKDKPFKTSAGVCKVHSLKNAKIK